MYVRYILVQYAAVCHYRRAWSTHTHNRR